jgi:hypothetical protein
MIKETFGKLLSSVKFWTTIVGMLVTMSSSMIAKWGFEVSDETTQQIAITVSSFFGLLLLGQASADHGKSAAQTTATMHTALSGAAMIKPELSAVLPHAEGVTVALSNGETFVIPKSTLEAALGKPAATPPAVTSVVATLGLLVLIIVSMSGCSWFKGTSDKPVASSVIDCMAKNIVPVKQQLGALAEYAIVRATSDDGSLDKAALKNAFRDAGVQTGGCLLADALSRLSKAASAALASGIKSEGVTVSDVQAKALMTDLYPGVTFKVE